MAANQGQPQDTSAPPSDDHAPPIGWRLLAYATPFLLIALLTTAYLVSPTFYLTYMLEYFHRESQAVEVVTFTSAFIACGLLFWSAWQFWRVGVDAMPLYGVNPVDLRGPMKTRGRGGAMIIAVVALATLFFGGEEINWGQSLVHWGRPEPEQAKEIAVNIHNNAPISVQGLGAIFLGAVFFGLPLAWLTRRRFPQIGDWGPAVAEGPVISAMAAAMLWKFAKSGYLTKHPDVAGIQPDQYRQAVAAIHAGQADSLEPGLAHYVGFFDQVNEQKEMLTAVALLLYGIYRVAAVRRMRRHLRGAATPG